MKKIRKKLNKEWLGIEEIIDISKRNTQKIQNINEKRKLITNHKEIATTFNKFFCNIPKEIEIVGIVGRHKNYQDYLINPIENTFNLDPANTEEVHCYIKTLKNNKSTGPSSISNKLFKQFIKPLSEPLKLLIKLTFLEGKFPAIFKLGKTIPVYKKGSKTEVDNYRPISLLPIISKIIEKMVHDRLYRFPKNKISWSSTRLCPWTSFIYRIHTRYTFQLRIVKYITLQMTLIYC